MCGICGFLGEDRERITRMTEALVHRGPDGNAVYTGNGVSFGHARLAILDPSPAGNQPMWNDAKTAVIVFNGEIYNYRQLAAAEGFHCRSGSDTEVLLKLYDKYGMDFVPKLRGMFAFGIYDTKTKALHLARDPHGIKPLYVSQADGGLCFASEMRSLIHGLKSKPKLDMASLSSFLSLQYVPDIRTMCEGIESFAPGTTLTFQNGALSRKRFVQQVEVAPTLTKADFSREFPRIMERSVEAHLVSDKPVGVFLSGGMDSSIVLHHMAAVRKEPVKTFTVRFDATAEEDAARFNRDADLALLTAKHYGTDHKELLLTAETYRNLYRETAQSLDQPNADSVSVAQFALARMAKETVDVVLSGAAGDELFGGYPRYRIARILHALRWIPGQVRGFAAKLTGYPEDVLRLSPGPELAKRLLVRPTGEVQNIVRGTWFDESVVDRLFRDRFMNEESADPIRQFMEVDRHLWLVDESLRLADAVTMGSGLECRVPFIDPEVIAWAKATPGNWHVTMRRTKALLKDMYRHILPEHLFTLPKSSFYPPLAKWFRRECAPLVEEALENPRIKELFDVETLREVFELHKARKRYGLHQLSNIVQLHFWLDTVYKD